jgi:TolA-binding protein
MLKPRKKLTKKQLKEDKLITYYYKAIDYINQNAKLVSGVVIGVIAVVTLSILIVRSKHTAEAKASFELSKARIQMSSNNTAMAMDILQSLTKNYSGTASAGRGIFYLANVYYGQKNYDDALKNYQKYIDDYDDDLLLSSSSYSGIGACYEQKQEYVKAAKSYNEGARKYPKNFEAPQQLMDAARCYRLSNNKVEAIKIYNKIITDYSESKYKREAEFFLNKLQS